uniref:hypothetical protein n=1 Tax=Salmonella sp. s55004 TaxID=3159675 RepID=UPI003980E0BF
MAHIPPATSVKHRNFVGESMGNKPVTAIAGIDVGSEVKLAEAGFTLAYQMLGQFLVLKKDKVSFCNWIRPIICNVQ